MDGYKAYKYYLALKLHFSSEKFNVFNNHGAVKYTRERFENRNDKFIFEKLSRKFKTDKEYIQYIASNYMYGNPDVVYSGLEGEDNYLEYIRRKQSISKILKDDIDTIVRSLELPQKINCINNKLPFIISLYLTSKITLESLRIIDDRLDIIHNLKMENLTLYNMFSNSLMIVEKSRGFIKYDKSKTDLIIDNMLEEIKDINHG